MKYHLFIIVFLVSISCFSQTIRFNKIYPETAYTLRNILLTDTGYVLLGGGGDTLSIILYFSDTLGNLKSSKIISKNGYLLYHGMENNLKKSYDTGYFISGTSVQINSNIKEVVLIKFNDFFDTLWTKSYLRDTLFISSQACNQAPDGFYYLTGEKGFVNGDSGVLLIKTDSSGNFIWYKTYGGVWPDYGTKIVNTFDNKLLIGGYTRSFQTGSSQYFGDWYLIKTDTASINLWQNHYGSPNFNDGWIRSLINTSDSGYVVGGHFSILYQGYYAYIIKFDKNLNLEFDKKYLKMSYGALLYSIVELPDKNFITCGNEPIVVYDSTGAIAADFGFLMKLTPNGDIIWKRNYNSTNSFNTTNNALSVTATPDHGYAFTGYVYDTQLVPPQQVWLVKTDSLGCDGVHSCNDTTMFISALGLSDTICFGDSVHITLGFGGRSAPYTLQSTTGFTADSIYYFDSGNDTILRTFSVLPQQENAYYNFTVTVTDPWGATKTGQFSFYVKHCSTSIASNNDDILEYQIFPNPAKEILFITSPMNFSTTVYLFNLQGKILLQKALQSKTEIDLHNYSQGIYLVKIVTEKGVIIKRIVKE